MYNVTHHLTRDIWQEVPFWAFYPYLSLSPSRRGSSSPKTSRRIRKDNPPLLSPTPSSCILFYGARCKLPKDWKSSSACCAPPGDELLLSRASRSRGLSRARPRKAQIAKNNIALDGEGENNRMGGGGGGGDVAGVCWWGPRAKRT